MHTASCPAKYIASCARAALEVLSEMALQRCSLCACAGYSPCADGTLGQPNDKRTGGILPFPNTNRSFSPSVHVSCMHAVRTAMHKRKSSSSCCAPTSYAASRHVHSIPITP